MILSHALRAITKSTPSYNAQYITAVGSTSTGSSVTFSGVSLGTASVNRIIIVVAAAGASSGTQSITSITINGTSTTLTSSPAGIACTAVGVLADDSLTSGTVVVTASGTRNQGYGIAIYTIKNSISDSVIDSDYTNSGAVTSLTINTISTTNPGFVVAALSINNSITSVTWTGVTSDAFVSGASTRRFHFARATTSSITSTYTVSPSWSGSAGATLGVYSFD